MFEKDAEERYKQHLTDPNYYENSEEESYLRGFGEGAEFGYNKAKEDVKHDLMMKLKDEGIVKLLKDSIFHNERLNSQEQQELCAWVECAMDFGENLDECAKELEQIRNERNLFQEKCEDIELNYYCDKLECRFLSRNKWHYVKDGLPKTSGRFLVYTGGEPFILDFDTEVNSFGYWVVSFGDNWGVQDEGFETVKDRGEDDVIAWKEIVLPQPPKYWDLSTGENNINKENE